MIDSDQNTLNDAMCIIKRFFCRIELLEDDMAIALTVTKLLNQQMKTHEQSIEKLEHDMDKEIKKGFEKVKKVASKEEKSLVKKDIKRDKKCDMAMKKKKK